MGTLMIRSHDRALEHADPREDLACLEAFVLDNDDLVSLEEQIGRVNIFDALRHRW